MSEIQFAPEILPNSPDFNDLPWEYPLNEWPQKEDRLEEIQHGISRHPVVFVNFEGSLYVIKELPQGVAKIEYESSHTNARIYDFLA